MTAELILRNGRFTTLDRSNPTATAVAIEGGRFTAVGRDADVMPQAGRATSIIDLRASRVLPGLIDNHLHIIRGGLNFNMELRWDGVRSLADAMAMLKRQVAITPPPQWVRVVGGFTGCWRGSTIVWTASSSMRFSDGADRRRHALLVAAVARRRLAVG